MFLTTLRFSEPQLQTEVLKLLATRRSERRFCCVDPWVITILYSNFKCYWLAGPPLRHRFFCDLSTIWVSGCRVEESAYFSWHLIGLFTFEAHWVGTWRRCVLMACLITRSWIQIWRSKTIAKYGICPVKGNYQVYVISPRWKLKWLLELSNQFGRNFCIPFHCVIYCKL